DNCGSMNFKLHKVIDYCITNSCSNTNMCTEGSICDLTDGICINNWNCGDPHTLDISQSDCLMCENRVWTENNKCMICPNDQIRLETGICGCPLEKPYIADNVCVSECPTDKSLVHNGVCVNECPEGYKEQEGECVVDVARACQTAMTTAGFNISNFTMDNTTITYTGNMTVANDLDISGCDLNVAGTLTINSGVSLKAKNVVETGGSYYGIQVLGSLETLENITAEGLAYGLYITGSVEVGNKILGATTSSATNTAGIYIYNNSTVTATGDVTGIGGHYGILSYGTIKAAGSVTAEGVLQGLHVQGSVDVDGEVSGTATNTTSGHGIWIPYSTGSITAKAGILGKGAGYGILTAGPITTEGSITAEGIAYGLYANSTAPISAGGQITGKATSASGGRGIHSEKSLTAKTGIKGIGAAYGIVSSGTMTTDGDVVGDGMAYGIYFNNSIDAGGAVIGTATNTTSGAGLYMENYNARITAKGDVTGKGPGYGIVVTGMLKADGSVRGEGIAYGIYLNSSLESGGEVVGIGTSTTSGAGIYMYQTVNITAKGDITGKGAGYGIVLTGTLTTTEGSITAEGVAYGLWGNSGGVLNAINGTVTGTGTTYGVYSSATINTQTLYYCKNYYNGGTINGSIKCASGCACNCSADETICTGDTPYCNATNNVCSACSDPAKPYWNGTECVAECSGEKPYVADNVCVESCPSSKPILDEENKICQTCAESNAEMPYWDGTSCVGTCPIDKPLAENGICATCPIETPYFDAINGICITECPDGTTAEGNLCLSETAKICYTAMTTAGFSTSTFAMDGITIKYSGNMTVAENLDISNCDLNVNGQLTVEENASLTVKNVTVDSTTAFGILNVGTIIVSGDMTATAETDTPEDDDRVITYGENIIAIANEGGRLEVFGNMIGTAVSTDANADHLIGISSWDAWVGGNMTGIAIGEVKYSSSNHGIGIMGSDTIVEGNMIVEGNADLNYGNTINGNLTVDGTLETYAGELKVSGDIISDALDIYCDSSSVDIQANNIECLNGGISFDLDDTSCSKISFTANTITGKGDGWYGNALDFWSDGKPIDLNVSNLYYCSTYYIDFEHNVPIQCMSGCSCSCTSNNQCSGETPLCSGGVCSACSGSTPYWNGASCVTECPNNTPFVKNGVCMACPTETPYWDGASCVAECPSDKPIKDEDKLICISVCPTETPYWDGAGCVATCPGDKPVLENAVCISCPTETPYWDGAGCVATCPSEAPILNEEIRVCQTCVVTDATKPYFDGTTCVSACPVDKPATDSNNMCQTCVDMDNTKPIWNGISCESCDIGTIWNGETCAVSTTVCADLMQNAGYSTDKFTVDGTTIKYNDSILFTQDLDISNCNLEVNGGFDVAENVTLTVKNLSADMASYISGTVISKGNVDVRLTSENSNGLTVSGTLKADGYIVGEGDVSGLVVSGMVESKRSVTGIESDKSSGAIYGTNTGKVIAPNIYYCKAGYSQDVQYSTTPVCMSGCDCSCSSSSECSGETPFCTNGVCTACSSTSYWDGTTCVEECPVDKPYLNGTACVAECPDDKPVPDLNNICQTCAYIDSTTPIWNGSSCEACEIGSIWDGEKCDKPNNACANLMEVAGYTDYSVIGNIITYTGNMTVLEDLDISNCDLNVNGQLTVEE
ncbi:MAG: hypothetical protein IKZ02_02430, partial [Alphaproteobacteria bacterium]|nr:hypothetical protein [Alphaproteobacteria bacterium]